MSWIIKYWGESEKSPVEKWILKLTKEKFKSISKEIILLEREGNKLEMPHSKALGKGLFELREREFGLRIYYGFKKQKIIVLLVAGDKSSQEKDIKKAYERLDLL